MKKPVIVIGIDSAEPTLLERWMSEGYLKNLSYLKETGSYGGLSNLVDYRDSIQSFMTTEPLWVTFITGCLPNKTGYWEPVTYNQDTYAVNYDKVKGTYDYQEYPPFYEYTKKHRSAIFDIPAATLSDNPNGVQVLGWGGHDPFTPSHSQPPELLSELTQKHGKDLIYNNDHGIWWDKAYCQRIQENLKTTISRRESICCDLLARDNWDLFMTAFGESHTVEHDLYGFSERDHPLYEFLNRQNSNNNPILETMEQIDRSIGEILNRVPKDANVICFSLHGMGFNHADLLTMLFLPEFLYRYSFPGKTAIGFNTPEARISQTTTKPFRYSWLGEIWARNYGKSSIGRKLRRFLPSQFINKDHLGLSCPFPLLENDSLAWMPSRWYAPSWHKMKAFALPAFTDGHIRINLKGREARGIVDPSEYDLVCSEIEEWLYQIKNARTEQPVVKKVIRTRANPLTESDAKLPNADLIVVWQERITDVVDSPQLGRIGPVPYFRLGGHRSQGFVLGKGPDIEAGKTLKNSQVVDLAPTILDLMGIDIPEHFDGKPLFTKNLVK